ncbi:6200_t:CDS:2, partial [Cetraspora pellucida]
TLLGLQQPTSYCLLLDPLPSLNSRFENDFSGPTNYELKSFFPDVLGFKIGTVFGASSFELPPSSVTLNSTISGPVNSELCGSVEYNNFKLCGSVNVELSLNLEPSSVNIELLFNLVLGSVDIELPSDLVFSSVNVKSLPCLVNPEYDSTWSGSEDFELSGFKDFEINSNLPSSVNFGFASSESVSNLLGFVNSEFTNNLPSFEGSGLDISINADINQMIQYNTTEIKLQVRDFFDDWNTVQCVVDAYSKQHSVNRPKKVENIDEHRNGVSGKTDCSWLVHFYFGKCAKAINITSIVDKHNHICDLNTIKLASKHLQFLPTILDRIKNYTIVGQLSANQQFDLLVKEFLQYQIKKKNLYNAISKFRGIRIHDESDTATILQHLLNLKEQDQEYVVIPCIEALSNHEAWARYSILKVFIAGTESTQKVKSINGVLKKHIDQGTLLKELIKAIKQELEKEASYNYIRDYYESNLSSGLLSTYNTIFKAIDLVLAEHLTPISLLLHKPR